MGIDFPTQKELLVYRLCKENQKINEINKIVAKEVGAKLLGYNDVKSLCKGIGLPKNQLCLACTNGDYSCLNKIPRLEVNRNI
jgi:glutamine phosphoribosylpyrophosphate amidotransferase